MKTYRQIFVYDPKIGYKFLPNLKVTIVGDSRDEMEDYKLVIDKFGYRNDLKDFSFNNNIYNVNNLFIGCSFTAGDGIINELRFTNLIGNSYNAGLSGSCNIQQLSIAEDCSKFLNPKRLIFSPYIGCLSRNDLSCRSSDFLFTRHKWHKPYFEMKDNKIAIRNLPVPPPSLDFNSEINKKTSFSFKNLYQDFIYSKIFSERSRIKVLIKPYKSSMHFDLCKKLYSDAKKLFPNSRLILAPIPHLEFLKYSSSYEKSLIVNFFKSLSKDLNYEYFELISLMKNTNYEKLYYSIDGHLNKKGHLFLSESFKNLFIKK
tara:strand:+ start:596 stop:1543 length:948 start_codon:yes stop_codon:yes gene_type:complete